MACVLKRSDAHNGLLPEEFYRGSDAPRPEREGAARAGRGGEFTNRRLINHAFWSVPRNRCRMRFLAFAGSSRPGKGSPTLKEHSRLAVEQPRVRRGSHLTFRLMGCMVRLQGPQFEDSCLSQEVPPEKLRPPASGQERSCKIHQLPFQRILAARQAVKKRLASRCNTFSIWKVFLISELRRHERNAMRFQENVRTLWYALNGPYGDAAGDFAERKLKLLDRH